MGVPVAGAGQTRQVVLPQVQAHLVRATTAAQEVGAMLKGLGLSVLLAVAAAQVLQGASEMFSAILSQGVLAATGQLG
jgi:hypothetical protein